MSEAEPVGSIGEEAVRLLRALGAPSSARVDDASDHACPASWCPVCQVAGFVRDNPEAIAQVAASAGSMLHALRGLVEAAVPPKANTPQESP